MSSRGFVQALQETVVSLKISTVIIVFSILGALMGSGLTFAVGYGWMQRDMKAREEHDKEVIWRFDELEKQINQTEDRIKQARSQSFEYTAQEIGNTEAGGGVRGDMESADQDIKKRLDKIENKLWP